jgi:enterochelin esterase family protein
MLMRLNVMFLVLAFAIGLAAQTASTEQDILAAYNEYFAALRHKDVEAAMKFVTSGYTSHLPDGIVLDFAGQAENLREGILFDITIGDVKVDIEQLQNESEDVIATVRCVLFYAHAPDSKPNSFNDDHIRDTWTHTRQGWKLKSSVYLRNTINGSIIPASTPPESPRLRALAQEWGTGNKGALAAFWKSVEGKAPLVEEISGAQGNLLVTYLWRSEAPNEKVSLVGSLPYDSPKFLSRLADTDVWYRTERMPNDSRCTYAFQIEGFLSGSHEHFSATAPDPLNPRSFAQGSYFELPNAPAQPYIKEQVGTPKGTLTRLKIKSAILNEERDYGVYTPAGYRRDAKPYDVVLLFDGEAWGNGADNLVPTPTILDNLIAQKKIPPTVLVMVNAVSQPWRNRDLTCSQPFNDFLAKELLPEVRKNYHVSADPRHVVVGGSSFGGLASACAGLMHPETFGNILSLSGSYWYVPGWEKNFKTLYLGDSGWVMQQYAKSPKLPLRFYMEVGRYEGLEKQLPTNRNLRDILRLKGYPVTYSEYDGGHDYLCWRGSVADGLIALLGESR